MGCPAEPIAHSRRRQIGFDWLCFFARSPFSGRKRVKLGLFGANEYIPDRPSAPKSHQPDSPSRTGKSSDRMDCLRIAFISLIIAHRRPADKLPPSGSPRGPLRHQRPASNRSGRFAISYDSRCIVNIPMCFVKQIVPKPDDRSGVAPKRNALTSRGAYCTICTNMILSTYCTLRDASKRKPGDEDSAS